MNALRRIYHAFTYWHWRRTRILTLDIPPPSFDATIVLADGRQMRHRLDARVRTVMVPVFHSERGPLGLTFNMRTIPCDAVGGGVYVERTNA